MAPQLSTVTLTDMKFGELQSHGKHLISSITPAIEAQTLPVIVKELSNDKDGGRIWLEPDAADLAKILEFEDLIKGRGSEKSKFRSSLKDALFEVWLTPDTLLYNHKQEVLPLDTLKVGDVIKAGLSLDRLSYAKTQFGGLWQLTQVLKVFKPKFMFDDEQQLLDEELAETL